MPLAPAPTSSMVPMWVSRVCASAQLPAGLAAATDRTLTTIMLPQQTHMRCVYFLQAPPGFSCSARK
jgi:hypothetical protein